MGFQGQFRVFVGDYLVDGDILAGFCGYSRELSVVWIGACVGGFSGIFSRLVPGIDLFILKTLISSHMDRIKSL